MMERSAIGVLERITRLEEGVQRQGKEFLKLRKTSSNLEERFAQLEEKFVKLEERQQKLEERFARLGER
ncbi:hypothetical protein Pyrde_1952 [Pyrodictium delaneyi]|uniref:Uncharacterized protein n=1 Tax=Pyrodictium delaneyi TaxID=1273541 RepID=A0A0P0N5D2_9CREN|nr:hypothetical protein [Pyrodictium delaneyi]ALL01995.1 hypothetical protein Pyrde_1952 [Pyrodictium delaneyi]OWJ54838.1 hypothetical protein Pdsh_03755 [Pyrodictium delaneyi]